MTEPNPRAGAGDGPALGHRPGPGESNGGMELTWPRVIGGGIAGGFALATAVAAGTWHVRQDRIEELEQRLAFFEAADKWDVPTLLGDLRSVNDSIHENLQQIRMYEDALEENAQLKKQLEETSLQAEELVRQRAELQATIDDLNERLSQKDAYIASLFSRYEELTLDKGSSKMFAGHDIVLGVVDVRSRYVDVTFDNEAHRLESGGDVEKDTGTDICNIYLTRIHWYGAPEKASFTLICRGPTPDDEPVMPPDGDSGGAVEKGAASQLQDDGEELQPEHRSN